MKINKQTILITGSSGFIGGNLLNKLPQDKYNLIAPNREELNLLDSESVFNFFSNNNIDVVLHCAANGVNKRDNNSNTLKNNLLMFFNIIKAKELFTKMINFGSGAEYDKTRDIVQISEEDFGKRIPKDDYGLSKFICAKYAMEVDFIIHIRLFGVFGEKEDYKTRFISNAICNAIVNKQISINQNVYFDYLYVNDLVRMVDRVIVLEKTDHKVYNVGSGVRVDLLSIAKKICDKLNTENPIKINVEGLNREYTCSTTRATSEFLKDFNFTNLDISIDELVDFYKNNIVGLNVENVIKSR